MCIVQQNRREGPAVYRCAQGGCRACLNRLMERHEGLVHTVLRRQSRGGVPYEDLLQEGRMALWKAILGFDPDRGFAFSTYAGVAIQRRIWLAVRRATRPQGYLVQPQPIDPVDAAAALVMEDEIRRALREAVDRLPERLRRVIIAVYGLDGAEPQTMASLGREWGFCGEWIRRLRNDALLLLRLPAFSANLRELCEQETRASYLRTQRLNREWLRQRNWRRGRR